MTGTGAQGRAVSRAFNNSGKWHVRVLTRNPNGPVAQRFKTEGMEIVQADFEQKGDLLRAFNGAYAVHKTIDYVKCHNLTELAGLQCNNPSLAPILHQ